MISERPELLHLPPEVPSELKIEEVKSHPSSVFDSFATHPAELYDPRAQQFYGLRRGLLESVTSRITPKDYELLFGKEASDFDSEEMRSYVMIEPDAYLAMVVYGFLEKHKQRADTKRPRPELNGSGRLVQRIVTLKPNTKTSELSIELAKKRGDMVGEWIPDRFSIETDLRGLLANGYLKVSGQRKEDRYKLDIQKMCWEKGMYVPIAPSSLEEELVLLQAVFTDMSEAEAHYKESDNLAAKQAAHREQASELAKLPHEQLGNTSEYLFANS